MPNFVLVGLFFVAAALGAQTAAVPPPERAGAANLPGQTLTLVGCVHPDETKQETFTLSVKESGTSYRLSGASMKGFVWRNVRVVGGLVPTPNIAAQAGAIDPARVAMAQQGADPQGSSNAELLEFRVTAVRPVAGGCSPKSPKP